MQDINHCSYFRKPPDASYCKKTRSRIANMRQSAVKYMIQAAFSLPGLLSVDSNLAYAKDARLKIIQFIVRRPERMKSSRAGPVGDLNARSEEHTSELKSLMRISYAIFCLKKQTRMYHITASSNIV